MLNSPVILKFGGSSVAEVKHWNTIVTQLQIHLKNNQTPILVLSALKGVSNSLEDILHLAVIGNYQIAVEDLFKKHHNFAKQLELSIEQELYELIQTLDKDCRLIFQEGQIRPLMHARVLAIGELLSTTIGAAYILSKGLDAQWTDARKILIANDQDDEWHHFTSASCGYEQSTSKVTAFLKPSLAGKVIITQGFIAADRQGHTVLLGREGSDTSAAYLAAIFGAETLQIWTDVPGVFTANPKDVPSAKLISAMTYRYAYMMARFGAKVLHPRVIEPAQKQEIAILVKSTWLPELPGTVISNAPIASKGALAVVSEPKVTRLILERKSQSNNYQEIFGKLSNLGFDLLIDSNESSQHEFWLKYTNTDIPLPSREVIQEVLGQGELSIQHDSHLISVVGDSIDFSWQIQAKNLVLLSLGPNGYSFQTSQQNDCISFYIGGAINLPLVNRLHMELIS